MKINTLKIVGVGGIKELELEFNQGLNVICGANGIGKTTILNVITDSVLADASKLKRTANISGGKYNVCIQHEGISKTNHVSVNSFNPDENEYRGGWEHLAKYILNFTSNRELSYQRLTHIGTDPGRSDYEASRLAISGIQGNDIKSWFVNRYMFIDKQGSLTEQQIDNYNLAKDVFGILDESMKFETVQARSFDIMLSTDKGSIFFEYLSSGYKTCIYILLGIIKEIEYRFGQGNIKAIDFDGIILIDEIDVHLHPTWQAKIILAFKELFPKAQIIVTTHSPSVLQTVEISEIIPLGRNEEGDTIVKQLDVGPYGLQGWTVEEILTHVMEMPSTTSTLYKETLIAFDRAMNDEDEEGILKYYNKLKSMLHPDNPLRKLLEIQIAEWED